MGNLTENIRLLFQIQYLCRTISQRISFNVLSKNRLYINTNPDVYIFEV